MEIENNQENMSESGKPHSREMCAGGKWQWRFRPFPANRIFIRSERFDANFKLVSDTSESFYSKCANRDRNSRVALLAIHHLPRAGCALPFDYVQFFCVNVFSSAATIRMEYFVRVFEWNYSCVKRIV